MRLSAAAKRPKITGDAKLALQAPVDPDGPTYHLMSDGEVNAEWNAEATSRLAQAARRPDENGMLSIQENEQAAEAAWSNPERASGGSFRWSAEGGTALSETEKQQAVFLAEELDVVPDLPKPATSFTRRWIADDAVTETELAERLARNGQNLYERPPQYAKLATPTGAGGASVFQLPAYAALVGGEPLAFAPPSAPSTAKRQRTHTRHPVCLCSCARCRRRDRGRCDWLAPRPCRAASGTERGHWFAQRQATPLKLVLRCKHRNAIR